MKRGGREVAGEEQLPSVTEGEEAHRAVVGHEVSHVVLRLACLNRPLITQSAGTRTCSSQLDNALTSMTLTMPGSLMLPVLLPAVLKDDTKDSLIDVTVLDKL